MADSLRGDGPVAAVLRELDLAANRDGAPRVDGDVAGFSSDLQTMDAQVVDAFGQVWSELQPMLAQANAGDAVEPKLQKAASTSQKRRASPIIHRFRRQKKGSRIGYSSRGCRRGVCNKSLSTEVSRGSCFFPCIPPKLLWIGRSSAARLAASPASRDGRLSFTTRSAIFLPSQGTAPCGHGTRDTARLHWRFPPLIWGNVSVLLLAAILRVASSWAWHAHAPGLNSKSANKLHL